MTSRFYKSLVLGVGLSLLAACSGVDDVGTMTTPNGGSSGNGTGTAGSGGSSGASVTAGTTSTAGGGGNGGASGFATGGGGVGGAAGGTSGGSGGSGGANGGAAGAAGAASGGMSGMGGSGGMAPFVLTSPAFMHVEACSQQNHAACKVFPTKNVMETIGGMNISPELDWGPGPQGTLSYVITLHDFTNSFTHWALWDIPAATVKLSEMLDRTASLTTPAGAQQKSFNKPDPGYMGPGAKDHVYEFRLYALNVATFTPKDATDQGKIYDELEADTGHIVLGKSMLRGISPN